MKTREQLKTEYEQELHELELTEQKIQLLPIPPDSFCGPTWKAPYVTYRKTPIGSYPKQEYTLKEALELVRQFEQHVAQVEARKNGCVSIQPPALQEKSYREGKLEYDACIFLVINGGTGYQSTELEFFIFTQGQYFHVAIELQRHPQWWPSIHQVQDWRGNNSGTYTITPRDLKSDNLTKYSAGDGLRTTPAYDIRYSWQNFESFYAWAARHEEVTR